jgi:hypothetical protein
VKGPSTEGVEAGSPGLRGAFGAACLFASLAGAASAFIVVDDRWGRVVAGGAAVALVLVPLSVASAVERLAARAEITLRASAASLVIAHVAVLGVLVRRFPAETGAAYARAPDRYGVPGIVGDALRRVGIALAGSAPPPSPAPTDASASARPDPSGVAPRPPDGGAIAFASGDPSYREDGCDPLADVSALAAAHDGGPLRPAAEALARARYPAGLPFLAAQDDVALRAWFTGTDGSFHGVASRFEVAVHEGAHLWRFKQGSASFPVSPTRTIVARPIASFPRSEILATHVDAAADSYAKTYLEGASGAQGFDSLLDEYVAYAHSLAARYCTRDLLGPGSRVSARDGILTMMYYVESYLAAARARHPRDYAAIIGDAGHRQVVLAVWDRAELWLRRSAGVGALGSADDRIAGWVYAPERLAEIERVRQRERAGAPPR